MPQASITTNTVSSTQVYARIDGRISLGNCNSCSLSLCQRFVNSFCSSISNCNNLCASSLSAGERSLLPAIASPILFNPQFKGNSVRIFDSGTSTGLSFTERFSDNLVGWVFDITIRQPINLNICEIPKA